MVFSRHSSAPPFLQRTRRDCRPCPQVTEQVLHGEGSQTQPETSWHARSTLGAADFFSQASVSPLAQDAFLYWMPRPHVLLQGVHIDGSHLQPFTLLQGFLS